jgi:hypothetical protein
MSFDTAILNFSTIYEQESFYRSDKSSHFVDLKDISGTNCMCDEVARAEVIRRIRQNAVTKELLLAKELSSNCSLFMNGSYIPYGLHFIDNGNFHYMSSVYLSMVKEPFSIVVFDHHPDMQRPMFDILSCGGWIVDVLDNNEFVRDVHVIGADPGLISELDEADKRKVHFYDIEDIFEDDGKGGYIVKLPESSFPIYLSIDKDVITKQELTTNWDQGEAGAEQILSFVRALAGCCLGDERPSGGSAGSGANRLLGVDICGECAPDQEGCDLDRAIRENDVFNGRVLDILREVYG